MRRAVLIGILAAGLAAAAPGGSAQAQTAMKEDLFDIQTALHYYGFMPGPVDGVMGPATERGLRTLGSYLRLDPVSPEAVDVKPLPLPLRTLMDAYAGRNNVRESRLDEVELGRLRGEGERFWIRKELQPNPRTWGVDVDPANDGCGANANATLVGEVIDTENLPELDGAGAVRVLYFGPVTADFRPDRLNIQIDPWFTVTNLSCG